MSARPRLEFAELAAFQGYRAADLPEHLLYTLSVDHLAATDIPWEGNDAIEVVFGLRFELDQDSDDGEGDDEDDSPVVLSAAFRLVYSRPPLTNEERKMLGTRRALTDVWPRFLQWLDSQLAMFGLAPAGLSPRPPKELLNEAVSEWEQTVD